MSATQFIAKYLFFNREKLYMTILFRGLNLSIIDKPIRKVFIKDIF